MKVAIWAKSPSPHQADFYAALRRHRVDLRVLYLEHLRQSRRDLGWGEPDQLPQGETVLQSTTAPLHELSDWRERVHVIPGYSRQPHRRLASALSKAGVPWVHWSESSQPVWRSYLTWTVKRWFAGMVNRAALGAFGQGVMATRDFQRWGIRSDKIAHLFYAVDGARVDSPKDKATAEFVGGRTAFVFVGSLCHRKACDVLLTAFAQVCSEHSGSVLVMVGDGPQADQYRSLVAKLRLTDRVLFRGTLPSTAIGSVLKCCQVLVLPSRFDGWGVVLNEAASTGLALVASDRVGAAYHVLEPGLNGYRVRACDSGTLAAAMGTYVRDPALAVLHGERSRARFQQFTPDANAARFISSVRGWLADAPCWERWSPAWGCEPAPRVVQQAA